MYKRIKLDNAYSSDTQSLRATLCQTYVKVSDFNTEDYYLCQKQICDCKTVADHSYSSKSETICDSMASINDDSFDVGINTMTLNKDFVQKCEYFVVPTVTCLA